MDERIASWLRPIKKGARHLSVSLNTQEFARLRAGQWVLLDGFIYTARDQAHLLMGKALAGKRPLPFSLKNQIIYYCGPTPTPPGRIIGACGPTTSRRMDSLTVPLLKAGLRAMIGKGRRNPDLAAQLKAYQAVYFVTLAGCGALLNSFVHSREVVAYPHLGPEAVLRLKVKDLPLLVAIDAQGRDIYAHL